MMNISKVDSCIAFLGNIPGVDWKAVASRLKPGSHVAALCPVLDQHRITQGIEDAGFEIRDCVLFLGTPELMVTLARVPLDGTVAQNVLRYGVGVINVDEARVDAGDEVIEQSGEKVDIDRGKCAEGYDRPNSTMFRTGKPKERGGPANSKGRWPANCILSKCPSVIGKFPTSGSGNGSNPYSYSGREYNNKETSMFNGDKPQAPSNYNDNGSASRFFHQVDGDIVDELVKYLVKLINPPGGKVLFLGLDGKDE